MKTLFLAALVATTAPILPAAAEPITVTRAVSHADLDLATERAVRRLDLRIIRAARAACGTTSSSDPAGLAEHRRCVAATVAAATPARDRLVLLSHAGVSLAAR